MNHGLVAYDKYSVKENRSGYLVENTDGSPVLDEKLSSGVMLDESTVKLLNNNWRNFRFYFAPANVEVKTVQKPVEKVEVVAKIDIPQPPNGEELKKDLTIEKLKSFTPEELDAVLTLCSKNEMLGLVGIEMVKTKLQTTKHETCMVMVKEKLNELKSE